MSTKGWAAPEVGQAYLRARELALQVGQPAELFATLWGLWLFNHTSGRLEGAKDLTAEILTLANREANPDLLLQAHHAAWTTDFFSGDLLSCRHHAEKGVALYNPEEHHAHTFLYGGHDPGVCCRDTVSGALWLLGYADQALVMANEAVSLAREVSHPFSVAIALNSLTMLHHHRREPRLAQEYAEATIELCAEQEIAPHYLATATVLRGWALANTGQAEEGIGQMRQGLSRMQVARAARGRMYYLSLLAECYGATGKFDLGLAAFDEAINQVETTGERWWRAEIHRLKGQFLLARPASIQAEAEGCFTGRWKWPGVRRRNRLSFGRR
jgi:predicted ATPase